VRLDDAFTLQGLQLGRIQAQQAAEDLVVVGAHGRTQVLEAARRAREEGHGRRHHHLARAAGVREVAAEIVEGHDEPAPVRLARERHGLAGQLAAQVKVRTRAPSPAQDRFWRLCTSPATGLPLLVLVLAGLFVGLFAGGNFLSELLSGLWESYASPGIRSAVGFALGDGLLGRSLLWGVDAGVNAALAVGIPYVLTFYLILSVLEDTGYLNSIAFLTDPFMHRLGLHGNMMTPLLLSFGCNVPAIMATKNLENKTDKILVGMMIPFMSCPARLVVFAFFSFIFFDHPAVVIVSLYLIGIIVAFLMALVLRRTYLKGRKSNFVLEMPPYRLPSYKTVASIVWAHTKRFLVRAGTVIFVISMIVWGLLNLPPGIKGPDESIAASIGKAITPVFKPIGLDDWRATTSLIPAFLAREVVLSSMAVIYKTSDTEEAPATEAPDLLELAKEQGIGLLTSVKDSVLAVATLGFSTFKVGDTGDESGLRGSIKQAFTPASSYSFMILLLLYNSCVATVAIMIKELGRKYSLLFLVGSFIIAWVLAFIVFNVWMLL